MSYPSNAERASRQPESKTRKGGSRAKRTIRVPDRSPEEQALAARLLDTIKDVPNIRQDLCEQVKQQIAQGAYETAERMQKALDRLVDELLEETDAQADLPAKSGKTD